MQRVEILSVTTKSKKIEIKGGFYNEADMKSELGYTPHRLLIAPNFEFAFGHFRHEYFNSNAFGSILYIMPR